MKRGQEEEEPLPKVEKSTRPNGGMWRRGPLLGQGGFGKVHLVSVIKPGKRFRGALPKVMAVKSTKASASKELMREILVLDQFLDCPFIIQRFGDDETMNVGNLGFEYRKHMFLEYASGGTLGDVIQKYGGVGLLESQVKKYTRHVLHGIKCIHERGYVHCDLKPSNILLVPDNSGEFVAKIADFGLAKSLEKVNLSRGSVSGTTMYLSPEAVIDKVQEQPSDIWALGCIVFAMLTGKQPWYLTPDERAEDLIQRIAKESPVTPSGISKEAEDFLSKCFSRNPKERPSAKALLRHPFVTGEVHMSKKPSTLGSSFLSPHDCSFIQISDPSPKDESLEPSSFACELALALKNAMDGTEILNCEGTLLLA
ncbi:hypothetical protein UlMin_037981 [Ulmus minor]